MIKFLQMLTAYLVVFCVSLLVGLVMLSVMVKPVLERQDRQRSMIDQYWDECDPAAETPECTRLAEQIINGDY